MPARKSTGVEKELQAELPWWLEGDEQCPICLQLYAFEIRQLCSRCGEAVCPYCGELEEAKFETTTVAAFLCLHCK